jgi:hypothetical protein
MACYMIGCRLSSPGSDDIALSEQIRQLGKSWECLGSSWVLASDLSAAEIRDALRPVLGPHDELFVAQINGTVAWGGMSKGSAEGLKQVLA